MKIDVDELRAMELRMLAAHENGRVPASVISDVIAEYFEYARLVPAEDETAEQIRCTNCGAIRAWDDEFGWTHIFDATPEPIDDPGPIETVARKRGSI